MIVFLFNAGIKTQYNGYYLAYFEYILTLQDVNYDVYIYNLNENTEFNFDWIGYNYKFKYLKDFSIFENYNKQKYIFSSTAIGSFKSINTFIEQKKLYDYVLFIDHDDILRNTNPKIKPYNKDVIVVREDFKKLISKCKFKSIITTSIYNKKLYGSINIKCDYYLPFPFTIAYELINKHDNINIKNNCIVQNSSGNLKLKEFKHTVEKGDGKYTDVLNNMINNKYFIHIDTYNKFDHIINEKGEGNGRQLFEATICKCISLSLNKYLYKKFIDEYYFFSSIPQLNLKLDEIKENYKLFYDKFEISRNNIIKEFSAENFIDNFKNLLKDFDNL